MNIIDPITLSLVSQALDASALRHAVHAQNIANASAEDYAPLRVGFEEHMGSLRQTLDRGLPLAASEVRELTVTIDRSSLGTSVEVDTEVAAMSQNTLHYQALLKALNGQLGLISLAVTEGRR